MRWKYQGQAGSRGKQAEVGAYTAFPQTQAYTSSKGMAQLLSHLVASARQQKKPLVPH